MNKKWTASLLLLFILTSTSMSALGDSLEDQLQSNQSKVQEQTVKQREAKGRIAQFSVALKAVQDELAQASRALREIEAKRIAKEAEIAENERLLKEAEARYHARMAILKKRVRDIYINGKLSYFDVILGAKDFNDFVNRVEFLRRIIHSDITLIDQIKTEREIIETKKKQLEQDRAAIIELEKEAQLKRDIIKKKEIEQQALLQQAENDKATAMEAIRELEASSNEIRAQIQARERARTQSGDSTPVHRGSGQFIWPANGVITSPFGWRTHPIYGRQILHSGIDIGVPTGTPIHAADGGTVILSGWVSGYGYTVVIDHGNGFSTLYAHNSELAVSDGQSVSQGEVIAYAGSTGNSTGPHSHFEVRVNGEPVDPMGYL